MYTDTHRSQEYLADNHVPTEVQNVSIRHTDNSSSMDVVDETTRASSRSVLEQRMAI